MTMVYSHFASGQPLLVRSFLFGPAHEWNIAYYTVTLIKPLLLTHQQFNLNKKKCQLN